MAADVFRALSDPTRRQILDRLAGGPRPAGALAEGFAMSQPAVSQHLKVLRDAGLVRTARRGRERIYQLCPDRLQEVDDWVGAYRHFWEARLDALQTILDEVDDG